MISNIITTLGIALLLFSSWQYTQEPPSCCSSGGGNSSCHALHVDNVVDGVNFHMPPSLNLTLAILGLLVYIYSNSELLCVLAIAAKE